MNGLQKLAQVLETGANEIHIDEAIRQSRDLHSAHAGFRRAAADCTPDARGGMTCTFPGCRAGISLPRYCWARSAYLASRRFTLFVIAPVHAGRPDLAVGASSDIAARQACCGFAFGLGYFGSGVSWIYISLHTYGAMPLPLAALATSLFCVFLALFPAAVGAFAAWLARCRVMALCAGITGAVDAVGMGARLDFYRLSLARRRLFASARQPAGWICAAAGSVRRIADAGAQCGGTGALAMCAMCWWRQRCGWSGWGLQQIHWTQPIGAPVSVSLLQGNIAQDMKWQPEKLSAPCAITATWWLPATGAADYPAGNRHSAISTTRYRPVYLDDLGAALRAPMAATCWWACRNNSRRALLQQRAEFRHGAHADLP